MALILVAVEYIDQDLLDSGGVQGHGQVSQARGGGCGGGGEGGVNLWKPAFSELCLLTHLCPNRSQTRTRRAAGGNFLSGPERRHHSEKAAFKRIP